MFCRTDSDDTYGARRFECGVVRATGVELGGSAAYMPEQAATADLRQAFAPLPRQQQSQQPQYRLILSR